MSTIRKRGSLLEATELDSYIDNLHNNTLKNKLAAKVNGHDFDVKGAFEFHITVRIKHREEVDKFVNFCHELGVKPIFIELPYGEEVKQLMTSKYITGIYPNILKVVYQDYAYKIKEKGFEVTRVKIESLACNKGVPVLNKDIEYEPEGRYFEFHFKIRLKDHKEKLKLVKLGKLYNAHTSRNAFKKWENGSFTNFLTTRAFHKGRDEALKEFNHLKQQLIRNNFEILGTEQEYTVYDSNLDLDNGWVAKPETNGLITNKYIENITDKSFYIISFLFFVSSIYYFFS